VEDGGHIAAEEQQGRVREVHHLCGLEDDDETERDERVYGAETQPVDEQFQQPGHETSSPR
jgi:hypothetical protein